jgi:hypothetical protein
MLSPLNSTLVAKIMATASCFHQAPSRLVQPPGVANESTNLGR